jgi:hypothetical protein
MVKPSGILAILLLKRPKGVRHIPMRFENARTHEIKRLSIASPQILFICTRSHDAAGAARISAGIEAKPATHLKSLNPPRSDSPLIYLLIDPACSTLLRAHL